MAEEIVDRAEFDRLLAEARNMRFEPEQERQFEAKTGPERSRRIISRGVIGLMLYLAYLAVDYLLTPDAFIMALVLRAGLVVPLTVITLAIVARNPTPPARDGLAAIVCLVGAAATLVIVVASADPLRQLQLHSYVLMAIFIAVTLNLRIAIAAMAIVALGLMYVLGLVLMPEIAPGAAVSGLAVFAASSALSLAAAQNFERNMRMAYLFGHSQRMRTSRLETLSRHDPLTGLGNRRALDEMLAGLASGDATKDLAVIVADIDHFKSYNDALGHLAGDQCLKRVAGIIASELRGPADRAVRFGGEEFLVLLPDADLWTAIAIAERIRAAIEAAAMPNPGRPFHAVVTASLGFAAGRLQHGVGADELIRSADAALYAAKNAGRNQVWPRLRKASEIAISRDRASGAA
ncbi:MAG TPA: GGDEF domain-containing protein [Devosia sp.]|nr:GGDEF domain-containing protein [Devosia sp.]